MNPSFSSPVATAERSPSRSHDFAQSKPEQFVGHDRETMSDLEREQAAYRAGCAMQGWYSKYQETGDAAHLDIAYHYLHVMRQILAGRTPEYVAKLEQERGLA
jgi:rhamnogalacturonyl hydrolase YesR